MSRMSSGPAVHQETEMVRQIDRNAEPPSSPEGRVRRGPVDLSVALAGVTLRSPIVSASGCFGSGREISEFYDLRQLGAVTVKSMTLEPWQGKPTPRMVETPSGMLNAIGLQNKGVEYFLQYDLRWLNSAKVPVIASIAGNTKDEFVRVADRLRGAPGPAFRPFAVRAVYEVHQAFPDVPIIGMGGVMNAHDALEMLMAGATAVAVGTANFVNPESGTEISAGMEKFMADRGIRNIAQ